MKDGVASQLLVASRKGRVEAVLLIEQVVTATLPRASSFKRSGAIGNFARPGKQCRRSSPVTSIATAEQGGPPRIGLERHFTAEIILAGSNAKDWGKGMPDSVLTCVSCSISAGTIYGSNREFIRPGDRCAPNSNLCSFRGCQRRVSRLVLQA